jgi:hypothetical protein
MAEKEFIKLSKKQQILLWCISVIGLIGVNGLFLYALVFIPEQITSAFNNVISIAFILEALLLLLLLCFLVSVVKFKSPGWPGFLLLSILGSLAFSIPFSIIMWNKNKEIESNK